MQVASETAELPDTSPGAADPDAAPSRPGLRRPSRRALVGGAIGWIALASAVALMQQPTGDALWAIGGRNAEWWLRPYERNPLLRLEVTGPLVRARLHPDTGAVFVTGMGGLIMRSTDEGRTWQQAPVSWLQSTTAAPAPAAATTSSNAVLDEVRLASQSAPASPRNLRIIPGEQKGPAPVEQQTIQEPAKGGGENAAAIPDEPIEPPPAPVPFGGIIDVAFAAGDRAWAVGALGTVLRSADGGATWEQVDARTGDTLYSVAAAPGGEIVCAAAGDEGAHVLRSGDGGTSWSRVPLPVEAQTAMSIVARPDGEMWASTPSALLVSTDACRTWTPRLSIDDAGFMELHFSRDGRRGLVAARETVYRTVDGGQTWRPGPALEGQQVLLHVVDDRRAFASSENGVVYETGDGGETWTAHRLPAETVAAVVMAGETLVGATEILGLVTSTDGGATWRLRSAPAMTSAHFIADGRRGWAVGERGVVLASHDSGDSWTPYTSGVSTRLHDIYFLDDGERGWAVGDEGVVIATTDGGLTWTRRDVPDRPALRRVWFDADGRRGSVLGSVAAYATLDGGETWRELPFDGYIESGSAAVRLADGWLFSVGFPPLLRLNDNGAVEQLPYISQKTNALARHPSGEMWAVGPEGFVAVSTDNGGSWRERDIGTRERLESIAFAPDGARGWILGASGMFTTVDGGATWRAREAIGPIPPHRIVPVPQNGAVALAPNGPIYRSGDGTAWRPLEHAAYPAPWYYVAVLLGLGVITLVISPGGQTGLAEKPSVADVFVSDRPLERGDPDALALNRVAAGLARFLANEKTDPPLTIAITGEWGSGKTSLMNLSREMLRDFGFRTVWFNAWHHQTEEHLLGALIESLRRDAIQPWWSVRGFAVRIRLLMFRGMRHWVPAAGALLGFCAAAGYFLQNPSNRFRDAVAWVAGLFGQGGAGVTAGNAVDLLSILGTAGGLVPLLKGMQAFGASGKQLSSTLGAYDPLRELKLPTGFRHRFAETFRDITRALEPQTLVLFIDDLDRCRPANVVATLEMVNFLVSSGRCIVVIGMARDRVERCVGLGFQDVAALDDADADPGEAKRSATRRLERFARQYLEKLINIEIPVPRATSTQSKQLLTSAFYRSDRYRSRWSASAKEWLQGTAAAVIVLLLVVAGYRGGQWVHDATATQKLRAQQESAEQQNARQPAERQAASAPAVPVAPPDRVRRPVRTTAPSGPAEAAREAMLVPGVTHSPWWPPVAVALALGVVAAFPRLARPRVHVEHDSPAFTGALDRWFPLMYEKSPTPRAIKRFLNRVRFYAMSQRHTPPPGAPDDHIPEDALVALSVLQHIGFDPAHQLPNDAPSELREASAYAKNHWAAFRRMAEGVSM